MKYQASAVSVVWAVWNVSPTTMYPIEMSVIVSQRRENQSRTSKPATWQIRRRTAIPTTQSRIFSSRRQRTGSWNHVKRLTFEWRTLLTGRGYRVRWTGGRLEGLTTVVA